MSGTQNGGATVLLGDLVPSKHSVVVSRTKKVAPCGFCEAECDRDEMWSINIKVFPPRSSEAKHIRIRACEECAKEEQDELSRSEWDNDSMRTVTI